MRVLGWLLVVLALGAAAGAWLLLPFGPHSAVYVDVAPGTGTAGIARQLQAAGVVREAWAFEAVKQWKGGVLKAGEYRFDHPTGVVEVYTRMARGDVYTRTLLIPEGYNIFDIAQAVQAAGLGSGAAFLQAEQADTALVARWAPGATSLEGFLFPDTYKFSPRATPEVMLSTMVRRFGQAARRLDVPDDAVGRAVTMASLVEREVHVDAERAEVAGVFENRLRAGMPLQTDPAVAYASMLRGTWTGVIHQSELHSDSPYNTYVYTGLPPGPVCNPGLAALRAALHPVRTDNLYFVADAHGATRFSRTLEEHNSNVLAYRAERDRMPAP